VKKPQQHLPYVQVNAARIIRLIKQATGNDIGIDIRDFEVLLTIPRQKASRLAAT
jgi:hypothetical protein